MSLTIWIAITSIAINIICIKELKRKQRVRKKFKSDYERLSRYADRKEAEVERLFWEVRDLERAVK